MKRNELLELCCEIEREYSQSGLKLTLRQMYYQLVARGYIDSGQKHYKRVGAILVDARYNGDFPFDGLEDRGRSVSEGSYIDNNDNVDNALSEAARYIQSMPVWTLYRDRWLNQPDVVSVWVEKEALSGVFEEPCDELGVSLFACKGYPSISSLYNWLMKMNEIYDNHDPEHGLPGFTVLYFGDHDPDGMEIPESAERNLQKISEIEGIELDINFVRVALNKDQIEQYDPPPFEAKITSTRFAKYCEEYQTENAWELDALEPRVLRDLIRKEVNFRFDDDLHEKLQSEVLELRKELKSEMLSIEWLTKISNEGS